MQISPGYGFPPPGVRAGFVEGQPQRSAGERLCGQGTCSPPPPDPLNAARQSVASDPRRSRAEQGGEALPRWEVLGLSPASAPGHPTQELWRELSVAEVRPGCCGEEGFVLGGLPACLWGPLMSDAGYLIKARHHLTDVCSECVTSAKVLPQPDADGGSGGVVRGGRRFPMPSGQDVGICSHGVWGLEPRLRLRAPRAARASARLRRGPVRGSHVIRRAWCRTKTQDLRFRSD